MIEVSFLGWCIAFPTGFDIFIAEVCRGIVLYYFHHAHHVDLMPQQICYGTFQLLIAASKRQTEKWIWIEYD